MLSTDFLIKWLTSFDVQFWVTKKMLDRFVALYFQIVEFCQAQEMLLLVYGCQMSEYALLQTKAGER